MRVYQFRHIRRRFGTRIITAGAKLRTPPAAFAGNATVASGSAVERVPSRSTIEQVPSWTANDPVAPVLPAEVVVAATSRYEVGTAAGIDSVLAWAASEAVGEPRPG